jgi:hypothetical protein
MGEFSRKSRWSDEHPAVERGVPCDLDALVPPQHQRPRVNWVLGHLDRMILILFLSVFIFMLVKYLTGS